MPACLIRLHGSVPVILQMQIQVAFVRLVVSGVGVRIRSHTCRRPATPPNLPKKAPTLERPPAALSNPLCLLTQACTTSPCPGMVPAQLGQCTRQVNARLCIGLLFSQVVANSKTGLLKYHVPCTLRINLLFLPLSQGIEITG